MPVRLRCVASCSGCSCHCRSGVARQDRSQIGELLAEGLSVRVSVGLSHSVSAISSNLLYGPDAHLQSLQLALLQLVLR